jgi:hypothetical protein
MVLKEMYPDCEIVSVDILDKWGATQVADICEWDYRQFPPGYFNMVWASPPCTEYSQAKTTGVRDLELADARVKRTLKIIDYLQPAFWFIENPRGTNYGLHTRAVMKALMSPYYATYCMYGKQVMKPTHIWSNVELPGALKACTGATPCEDRAKHGRHVLTSQAGPARRADGTVATGSGKGENVYPIPAALLEELFQQAIPAEAIRGLLFACLGSNQQDVVETLTYTW